MQKATILEDRAPAFLALFYGHYHEIFMTVSTVSNDSNLVQSGWMPTLSLPLQIFSQMTLQEPNLVWSNKIGE